MVGGLVQGVLADANRAEAEKEFTQRDGAKDGIPSLPASGDDIGIGDGVIMNGKIADVGGTDAAEWEFFSQPMRWLIWEALRR